MAIKVGFMALGCEKNRVDMEIMMGKLNDNGFHLVNDIAKSDIAVINTCAFIDAAKEESIEEILEVAKLKADGDIKYIVVTGCLAERYRDEVLKNIPEVDAVVSLGGNTDIVEVLNKVLDGNKVECFKDKLLLPLEGERVRSTLSFSAYIKIAEGCDNWCAYCSIPRIRGKFRSRTMESILAEAKQLAEGGVKELNVIAQDTSRYGEDIYNELMLPQLLSNLCKIDGIEWIRLLYCYPDRITDELLEVMAKEDKIVKYIDMPLQHSDGKLLKSMNRFGDEEILGELINKIRRKIPNIAIRTTFIVGFPGETEKQFNSLCEFNKKMRFERMGCFSYSPEEKTKAYFMDNQIDDTVKAHRQELLMSEQYEILNEIANAKVGETVRVLVEGYDTLLECFYGRSYMDAPDIDTKVFFKANGKKISFGDFVEVEILDVVDCDLIGQSVNL